MNLPTTNQCRVHTIVGEVQSVIATMRNNNRFSTLSTRESPLLKEFKQLRSQLRPSTNVEKLDPMIYLKPFLNVIHSEETSGPITGAALTSVDKFLTYGFLRDNPNSAKAMKKIADTVVHCRFEATSLEGDDVVLMKILRVLLSCLSCPAGGLLSDNNVFEMISICYRMSRGRLSELLKKTAERTLTELVHIIFLVNNVHNKIYYSDVPAPLLDETLVPPPSPILDKKNNGLHDSTDYVNPHGVRFQRLENSPSVSLAEDGSTIPDTNAQSEIIPKPYGVGCVIKTFKFLVELTSPHDENIPESLHQISIQLLNTIVETQPQLIERIPSLLELLCNHLCKSMLQNIHTENLDRLNLSMRFFFNLYISLRRHLKMQFEVFFNNLLRFILHNNKYVSFEKQEIVLENLVQFFYLPTFMTDIFANYDCHIHCTNSLEKLATFLYKSAFPLNGTLYSIQLLSLECLLALCETISTRCKTNSTKEITLDNKTEELIHQRASKVKYIRAAEEFNKKPALGFQYLKEQEMIPQNPSQEDIALFLRNAPGLDKKKVGEYLGKEDKEFIRAYVKTFDFTGIEYVDAVRLFLTSFVMSGEAQIIDRIVECFAHHWYYLHPGNIFATADVAYVLCYSIVMLNVDAHNLGVKTKMTEEEYIYRLRGINDGKDLPRDFLEHIYRNITQNEIKITDNSPEGEITDEKWHALLQRSHSIGRFVNADINGLDRDVFLLVCRAIIAALSIVFETTVDNVILEDVLGGFINCSQIASHFKLSAVFDNVIIHLCKFTTLVNKNKKQYASSPKRITLFGTNKKAQLATTTMFSLVLKHGDQLREAWRNIVRCIICLNEMELLEDVIDEDALEARKKTKKSAVKEGTASTGLLSFIPSWWNSDPVEEEVNQSDIDAENTAKKTIASCSIKSIIESSCKLQSESLVFLIKALILDSTYTTGNEFHESNAMFCLELLTKITLINHSRINFVWVLVSDHFAAIVQTAKTPSEFVEKAIVCLLLLCVTLAQKKEISSHIFDTFELFLHLEPSVADAMSESIIIAVSRFLKNHSDSIPDGNAWNIILSLIERSANSAVAYERGFDTLTYLLQMNQNPSIVFNEAAFHPYLRAVVAYISINEDRKTRKGSEAPQPILSGSQAISTKALNILYSLFEGAAKLPVEKDAKSQLIHESKLWNFYWLPIFQYWIKLCRDPRNDVRFHAIALLQRALLSQYLDILTPEGIRNCFEEVMFPLLESLLEPFANTRSEASRIAVEETRVRAQQLLSKSLLQYLHPLTQLNDFHTTLWPKILCMIEAYMKADENGLLREAIPEVLKNILLVMLQMNVFHPSNTIHGQDIWTVSWMTIDGFCPTLKQDESFRASLNTFQKSPSSSQTTTAEASKVIHQLAKQASPKISPTSSHNLSSTSLPILENKGSKTSLPPTTDV